MAETTVVNVNFSRYDVYIGRPTVGSPWRYGNPFVIGEDGDREQVIQKFKDWIYDGRTFGNKDATDGRRNWILANLWLLKGKRLGCFCHPKACHGNVYVELLKEL